MNFNMFVGVEEGVEVLFSYFGMYILSSTEMFELCRSAYKLYVVQFLHFGIHKRVLRCNFHLSCHAWW